MNNLDWRFQCFSLKSITSNNLALGVYLTEGAKSSSRTERQLVAGSQLSAFREKPQKADTP
jgi:hypothetical protein